MNILDREAGITDDRCKRGDLVRIQVHGAKLALVLVTDMGAAGAASRKGTCHAKRG